jgi:hypothetical protein
MRSVIRELEKIAHQLEGEGEEKLRSRILGMLRQMGYKADAESDNRGHTDLLVESGHLALTWIAEAKKHGADEDLIEGMKQLHNRYSSGRHRDNATTR